jgi:hypothetical protein
MLSTRNSGVTGEHPSGGTNACNTNRVTSMTEATEFRWKMKRKKLCTEKTSAGPLLRLQRLQSVSKRAERHRKRLTRSHGRGLRRCCLVGRRLQGRLLRGGIRELGYLGQWSGVAASSCRESGEWLLTRVGAEAGQKCNLSSAQIVGCCHRRGSSVHHGKTGVMSRHVAVVR